MKISDFIRNSIYKGLNQKLPSYLLGDQGTVNAIQYALNDIYTYEGKYWTFMYDSIEIDLTGAQYEGMVTVEIDIPYPMLRVLALEDLSDNMISNYSNINFEPFDGKTDLAKNELYFKPHTKKIKLYNNSVGYILHYIHYFDKITYDSDIPIPEIFESALYNGTLTYIYPNYGQVTDQKEINVYNKFNEQLKNLSKSDSMQLSGVVSNIN